MMDSHIHLSYAYYDQLFPYIDMENGDFVIREGKRDSLIREMKKRGIECCIEPAIDVASNELLLRLSSQERGFIYPAVGNHPTRCIHSSLRDFKRVREYAKSPEVVAIGETGLDYHYERKKQHRLKQKLWFQWQINLAHEMELPLILHIRLAHEDALRILTKNKGKLHGGVCHCFAGGADVAKVYTEELGLCLGIGGTLLMKQQISESLKQAVASVSMESLLLETDGPYVKPERPDGIVGKRWKKAHNTSLILPAVAKRIAEIKDIPIEDVMKITAENTKRVFHLT